MAKRALITGITGQDGSYLAELLLSKDYEVHGLIRRSSSFNTGRIDHIYKDPHEDDAKVVLHYGDLTDSISIRKLLDASAPDEIYHLGAQSHVRVSFDMPEYTSDVVATGTLRLLEAVREFGSVHGHSMRFYNATSSEMFGSSPAPQNEQTPFRPCSPYAVSKIAAYYHGINYREAHGLFLCNGILFNHESERRSPTFVTRKISRGAARIKHGLAKNLHLGNMAAIRDWGHAEDYVRAMWMMLQQEQPDDYVIATGESHTVREFLTEAFGMVDLNWQDYVVYDRRYDRPREVEDLQGDWTKARKKLGWEPKVTFQQLVRRMVEHDVALAKREASVV